MLMEQPMSYNVKQAMLELVQRLPDECTWNDVMEQVYVRQRIEAGLEDDRKGLVIPHEEVFKEFR